MIALPGDLKDSFKFPLRQHRRLVCLQDGLESFLDLAPLLGRRIDGLSGGERQRIAIARAILKETFESAPLSEWRERLADFEGQWAVAQDSIEVTQDVQVEANGYLGQTATADGTPFTLVTTPVQFGGVPAAPKRSPEFNEHCEEILADIDCSEEEMIELKVAGVLA